jgi:DNA mismatch repair protein MutL
MGDLIKLLPEHVANQIAAGEVIQRPASVVKELLENAIDAGAQQVKLILKDAGKAFIQVIDNGKGMSASDAKLCWERHATSKINSAEDIYNIRTMGFRGEALASIASVAQVEMRSRRAEGAVGTLIQIEGSDIRKVEEAAMNPGTSISVRNLFYNIPARRNFLKSNPVETRHIIDELMRAALANPETGFSMHHNDEEVFDLKPGDLRHRISELFGNKQPADLLALSEHTSIVNVTGFVGGPSLARKNRGEQFFFVNRRYIRDPYLNHAVVNAFESLISKEQYPFYVIHFDIDPSLIDVNIHPTKTEIKFEDEKSIYQIVRAVTRKALGQHYHIPTFEPASEDSFLRLPSHPGPVTEERIGDISPSPDRGSFTRHAASSDWQQLFDVIRNTGNPQPSAGEERETLLPPESPTRNIMQLHHTLILSQVKSGIMLIDQQAAHERVLYERYCAALESAPLPSQQKLFPKAVTLAATDEHILREILHEIRSLGFDINELGRNTFVVNGVPSELNDHPEQELVDKLLEQYKQHAGNIHGKKERVARAIALRAAIKAGTRLSHEEMTTLIDQLFACRTPDYSPDGKRCVVTLRLEELMTMLSRR